MSKDEIPDSALHWCEQVVDIMAALDQTFDDDDNPFDMDDDTKPFLANAVRQLLKAANPQARLKKDMTFTPHSVGAMIGHKWAFFRDFGTKAKPSEYQSEKALAACETNKFLKGLLDHLQNLEIELPQEKPRVKASVLECISIALDQNENDFRQFMEGFSNAVGSGTITTSGTLTGANSTTQLCLIVLMIGPSIQSHFRTVNEFHGFVTKTKGQNIAGSLAGFQKFCNRIQLSFGKPQRPQKNKDTEKISPS